MPTQRPNVLVILDDQHRHDFVGYMGADFVHTPHLDALAARGMAFSHCCTTSPVCGPARIALATGLLPTRTGTSSNETSLMPLSVPNHYRHFRDHGYRVELVGRHDLAKPGAPASIHGNRPLNFSYGFTRALEVEGGMSASREFFEKGASGPYTKCLDDHGLLGTYAHDFRERQSKGWIIGASHDSVLPAEHHQDAFVGRYAAERIRQIEDDYPWYLFVNFQSPHDPFDPPAELGEKYREAAVPPAIPVQMEGKPRRIRDRYERLYRRATTEDVTRARRQYCAKIELIDQQIGRIMQALADRGMVENTLVVFASDHGEQVGDHGLFIKHTAYESSMRVPLLVAGPGVAPGTSDALVELFDLNPTLAELAGLPPQPKLDARSFASVLHGEAKAHRDACVTCEEGYRAIRERRYKYIETTNDLAELYDLETDPEENRNILSENRPVANRLRQALHQRFVEGGWQH
jgi:choline-sulfatase